jgi:hypothetical protein
MSTTVESTDAGPTPDERGASQAWINETVVRSLARALDSLNVAHTKHAGTRLEPMGYYYRDERTDEANRQLARLWGAAEFEPGWDGHDAEAPSKAAIKAAEAMIMRLATTSIPIPSASVGADGQSNLYWKGDDFYADVDVFDSTISYLLISGDHRLAGEESLEEGLVPPQLLMALMDKFNRELR